MIKKIFPDHIKNIAITAPAGRPDAEKLATAVTLLQDSGFRVIDYIPQAHVTTPAYLAADVAERAAAFNAAVNDPQTDLILCARGGFGSVHLLDLIDYNTLKQRNLPVMGYSDITALHCAMLKFNAGIPIAGSTLLDLPHAAGDMFSISSHFAALDNHPGKTTLSDAPQIVKKLPNTNTTQSVQARPYAANLTVLSSLCGTPYFPDFRNMILILEDVNEPLYKLDRMLCQLAMNHTFAHLAALVFGCFTSSETTQAPEQLFCDFAKKLSIPVFSNFQFGHLFPMCALNAAKQLQITAGEPATIINF